MSTALDLSEVADRANRDLEGASALEILTWAHREFGSKLVIASSMADTVMIHLAEQVAAGIDVIFLDTGYHFIETIGTRDAVKLVHNVNVINVTPEQAVAEQDATWGKDLFARDPDQCCALRNRGHCRLARAVRRPRPELERSPRADRLCGRRVRADAARRAARPTHGAPARRCVATPRQTCPRCDAHDATAATRLVSVGHGRSGLTDSVRGRNRT